MAAFFSGAAAHNLRLKTGATKLQPRNFAGSFDLYLLLISLYYTYYHPCPANFVYPFQVGFG